MTDQTVVIAVVNSKGGVGKTTTAVHLAAAFAAARRNVLLVDLDSQASASIWFGVGRADLRPSSATCLLQHLAIQKAVRHTANPRIDLVTGSVELANVDLALGAVQGRELTLKRLLQTVKQQYGFVLLDCPPSLSLVSINALVACDGFIVPVTPQFLAVEGLVAFLESVEKVRSRIGAKGRLLGILLARVDAQRSAARELAERLRAQYRERIFHTEIPDGRALAEAPAAARTVFDFAPRSKAADAYRRLAGEVLESLRQSRH